MIFAIGLLDFILFRLIKTSSGLGLTLLDFALDFV
jgi:hypothetical protein